MSIASDTVSYAAAMDLINTCKRLGLLTTHDLNDLNMPSDEKHTFTARLSEKVFVALWQRISSNHRHSDIGLKIGQTINPEAKGLLASWISQTDNLNEAFTIFSKHISLMNPSESWQIEEGHERTTLTLSIQPDKGYPTMAIERSMSAMVNWARWLSNHTFPIHKASFTFPQPDYLRSFTSIFGNACQFDQNSNSLVFDSALLKLPILSSNPALKSIVEEKARDQIAALSGHSPTKKQVLTMLRKAIIQGQSMSMMQVCEAFGLSRQTLYRKLQKEGTSFHELHDISRKEAATKLLESGQQSIDSISRQLGFKDSSSFYKAQKRWFNTH